MQKRKYTVGIMATILALQVVPAYASEVLPTNAPIPANTVGKIVIKETPAPTAEEIALKSVRQQRQQKKNMGNINIANDIITSLSRGKKPDTPELARVKSQLADAIEAANEQYFYKALTIMEHLHVEHPESRAILKWLGVYQNWAGKYEESTNSFEDLTVSYPLNPEDIENDFMVAYYTFDNARHLGIADKSQLEALQKLAEKQGDYKLGGGRTYEEVAKTLAMFQKFMIETDCGKTLKPTDSKALDELWKTIPKNKQAHLDNYFGYNIDELTPIYASFYHRKDLTEAYDKRQQLREEHIKKAELKNKPAEAKETAS